MTRNGGRRALQDRRLAELSNSKLTARARDPNQNTTFSTESTHCSPRGVAASEQSILGHSRSTFNHHPSFQIRRQHNFDPFHECADSARQITPMCYDEGHGERPATRVGNNLHKRPAF